MSGFDVWERGAKDDDCFLSVRVALLGLVIPWAALMALVGGPSGFLLALGSLVLCAALALRCGRSLCAECSAEDEALSPVSS